MKPSEMTTDPASATSGGQPVVARISREIVRLYGRIYGRGPTRAKTIWRDEILACVLEDVFTKSERLLVDLGRFKVVRDSRQAFSDIAAPELRRLIEEATGREVSSQLGQVAARGVACELFVLERSGIVRDDG